MQKQKESKSDNVGNNQVKFVQFPINSNAVNLAQSPSNKNAENNKQNEQIPSKNQQKTNENVVIPKQQRKFKRSEYFLDSNNWKRNDKTNRVILLNKQWKGYASKIIGFVLKKFLTTGSFMGISFPVFAMKPQGILQTYAKSLGVAPILFNDVNGHQQRMKNFIAFMFTVSLLNFDSRKPFNPVFGQTYQATIAGGNYSAQQICHHPPISAFYYEGKGYRIYGQLELSASLSLNSGEGRFIGDITVQFDDGYWIKGRIPNGELSGFVYGETQFNVFGGSYAYDCEGVVCTYQLGSNSLFQGLIGRLNEKSQKKFNELLKTNQRFIKFSSFKKDDYRLIFNRLTIKVGFWISFDGIKQFNFDEEQFFPYLPQDIDDKKLLLKSDSRFRKDITCAKQKKCDKGQQEKEIIEDQQRRYRKLRQKYNKIK